MNAHVNATAAARREDTAGYELTQLTDGELLASTRRLVGVSNRVLAAAKLVQILDPLPDVPARIEPLGAALSQGLHGSLNPSWEDFLQSMCPRRDLLPGERPRDWANDSCASEAPHGKDSPRSRESLESTPGGERAAENELSEASPTAAEVTLESSPAALARDGSLVPQRYKVQFTAGEGYVRLVERAKGLLSHALPEASLEDVHFRAMEALVATLEKRAYGGPARPPRRAEAESVVERDGAPQPDGSRGNIDGDVESAGSSMADDESKERAVEPRRRGRYIPAAERRSSSATGADAAMSKRTASVAVKRVDSRSITCTLSRKEARIQQPIWRCAAPRTTL